MRDSEAIKLKYEKQKMGLALGTCNYSTQLVIKQKGFIEEMASNLRFEEVRVDQVKKAKAEWVKIRNESRITRYIKKKKEGLLDLK